ncbi:unnamed protein product [Brassica rapa subsp. trilocularis]
MYNKTHHNENRDLENSASRYMVTISIVEDFEGWCNLPI